MENKKVRGSSSYDAIFVFDDDIVIFIRLGVIWFRIGAEEGHSLPLRFETLKIRCCRHITDNYIIDGWL